MSLIIPTPPTKMTLLAGDHHGEYGRLKAFLENNGCEDSLIIHMGDGSEGLDWFTPTYIHELDAWFKSRNSHYWSIRVNHSDPAFFQGNWMLPNFKLLPDNSQANLHGKKWLFVGGATSIDRIDTIMGVNWWPDEIFVEPENPEPCDVLITHTGPPWVTQQAKGPLVASYEKRELSICGKSTLWQELQAEAAAVERLFQKTKPKQWFLGHFHQYLRSHSYGCDTTIIGKEEIIEYLPPTIDS